MLQRVFGVKYEKILVFDVLFFFCTITYAKSNLVGTWINDDKILSIQIVDDPAAEPFTAGELFKALIGNNQNKSFKTKNLEIKCSAVPGMNGNFFGSCRIRVSKDSVENLGPRQDYLFGVLDKEATEVLSNFNKFPDNFLLVYGDGTGDFRLEANWKKNTFAFLLNHDFVTTD